ncbi:MAG: hypothetical protein CUN57_03970, partial [Phototrophicales bacterium]
EFPQVPFTGFPAIDTRGGVGGRWDALIGDCVCTLAITDTGSILFFNQLRQWADVNTIVPDSDSLIFDPTYSARFLAGVGMTRLGTDTLVYAKINGVEFGVP